MLFCGNLPIKQWGAQENLWPKFILKSAPLRATSSAADIASAVPIVNN